MTLNILEPRSSPVAWGIALPPSSPAHFLGRIFDHPARVFPEELLRPEIQDLDAFVDGVHNVVEAQQRVACQYFEDQSIEDACPPLLALLSIMAKGTFEGRDVHHPEIRRMFTLDYLLGCDWYRERLVAKQQSDVALWQRHLRYVDECLADPAQMWAENPAELLRAPRDCRGRARTCKFFSLSRCFERHPWPRPQPAGFHFRLHGACFSCLTACSIE